MSHLRILFVILVLATTSSTANAAIQFIATINGAQEAPSNGSTASGFATFLLNDAMSSLSFNATIFGLDFTGSQTPGNAADDLRNAHIHARAVPPSVPGTNGPVVWGFIGTPFNDNNPNDAVVTPFVSGVGGTVSGKWDAMEGQNTTLTAQLPNLLAGLAYINFHTVGFPGGEIRGQILPTPEPSSLSVLGVLVGLGLIGHGWRRRRQAGSDQHFGE